MSDLFSMFGSHDETPANTPKPMTVAQRHTLRELFRQVGRVTAQAQFELVEELTGQRLRSVAELDERTAQALIIRMRHRVKIAGRSQGSGNVWDDREEDTWIDKL